VVQQARGGSRRVSGGWLVQRKAREAGAGERGSVCSACVVRCAQVVRRGAKCRRCAVVRVRSAVRVVKARCCPVESGAVRTMAQDG